MVLFQNSVLKKHLKLQEKTAVDKAYKKFAKYFHDTKRQQNIRESKEEQYQEGFLRELFVKTDSEIDQMMYRLYELTEEEIAIVENAN